MSLYVVVEGHGEVTSMGPLVERLRVLDSLMSLPYIPARNGVQRRALVLDKNGASRRLTQVCELFRARSSVSALLLTCDADDACPKDIVLDLSQAVREQELPFPAAVVLFHREYETMFLAASGTLAGSPLSGSLEPGQMALPAGSVFYDNPERARDAKGWLRQERRSYVPTIHQPLLTRTMDLSDARLEELSSFRRLRAALRFLERHVAAGTGAGEAYPPT